MPWPLYVIALIIGGIIRVVGRAVEEERRSHEADQLRRRENQDYLDRYREVSARVPQPVSPRLESEVPVDDVNRRSRRFALVIPLADNQIAITLRPVRARAISEVPGVSGLTFTAQPGGSVVDVIVNLEPGALPDEARIAAILTEAGEALRLGYRAQD